jgi:hypothetical protein
VGAENQVILPGFLLRVTRYGKPIQADPTRVPDLSVLLMPVGIVDVRPRGLGPEKLNPEFTGGTYI